MPLFIDGVLTMAENENQHEARARAVKVSRLVNQIWSGAEDGDRADPLFPWTVGERKPAKWWTEKAMQARVRIPSGISRERVVIELCKRVNAARHGATEPCPDCEGSLTLTVRGGGNGDPEWDGERDCDACVVDHQGEERLPTGKALCEDCREAVATLSVPTGFFCEPCAAKTWPEIVRAAATPVSSGAASQAAAVRRAS